VEINTGVGEEHLCDLAAALVSTEPDCCCSLASFKLIWRMHNDAVSTFGVLCAAVFSAIARVGSGFVGRSTSGFRRSE